MLGSLDGVDDLTLDLKDLEYIASAGLRVILKSHKRMMRQGKMKLVNVGESVMEVLVLTGMTDILTIE